ncbi:MAG: methyl-accepting chemotaxis protein [Elusimicrobiota bacterium]
MDEEKSKRSQIVVKRTLQLKYAAVVLLAMLATALTVGADFYIRLHGFVKDFLGDLPDRSIEQLMMNMNQLMYAKLVVLILIATAISLYISHKFAGPIVHIEKSIGIVANGDLTHKVYFRSGDELKHLADYFNYMMGQIRIAVGDDRAAISEVTAKLDYLKSKVVDNDAKEELDGIIAKLKNVTGFWKMVD